MIRRSRPDLLQVTLLVVAFILVLAYAAGLLFQEDKTIQRWSLVIGSTASVIGAVVGIFQFYRWCIRRNASRAEHVRETLEELRSLACRRGHLWGGRSSQPGDYFDVPWSFTRRYGTLVESPLERAGHGGLHELAGLLTCTKRSVIVLGPSGAGKTTLAELVPAVMSDPAFTDMQPLNRVPVYLHLSEWDPTAKDLVTWAVDQLTRRAALSGVELLASSSTLTRVLKDGLCLLLLDGFDELDPVAQKQAVQNIVNNRSAGRIVILSQGTLDQLQFATKLLTCDVVTLEPLSAIDVADLILLSAPSGSTWSGVAERVSCSPDSILATVLRRPLFLSLALQMVHEDQQAPDPMLKHLANKELIEGALLGAAVRAALASRPQGVSVYGASPRRLERWLRSLGRIQASQRRENTVWWDLADEGPVWGKALFGGALVYAVVTIAELGAVLALGVGESGSVLPLALATFVALATKGNRDSLALRQQRWYRSGAMRFAIAFTLALAFILVMESSSNMPLHMAVLTSLPLGGAYLLMALLFRDFRKWLLLSPTAASSVLRTWLRGLGFISDHLPRAVPRQVGWAPSRRKLAAALLVGLFAAAGVILTGASPWSGRSVSEFWANNGPVTAAGVFATNWFFFSLVLSFGKPLDSKKAQDQATSVRSNLAFGAISFCLWCLAGWVTASVWALGTLSAAGVSPTVPQLPSVEATNVWLWILPGLVTLVLFFGALAVVGATVTLGGRFLLALLWLRLVGAAPLRYFTFLDWGHERGLLRRQGLAFAFRHPRFRDVLVHDAAYWESGEDLTRTGLRNQSL